MGYVEALQREHAGYVARGLKERAAQVEAELTRLGVNLPGAGMVETAAAQPPARRSKPKPSLPSAPPDDGSLEG